MPPASTRWPISARSPGKPLTYDWVLRSQRGVHHMQTTLSPLHDPSGQVTGIVGVGRDVSQRVEAGRELQRWARIFEHAGWGVAIISADGQIIESVNPAFALMHGWRWTSYGASSWPISRSRRAGTNFRPRVASFDEPTGTASGRPSGCGAIGASFPALIDATAVKDADGQVICYAVNVQDLTERRRAEEQVRQAQKMEAVGRLAGGVAHDFNNMMMIIMGFSDFLLTTLDRDDPRWADADEIRKAAERAMHLTRQLLGFGRQQLVAR